MNEITRSIFVLMLLASGAWASESRALSPSEALASFEVEDGLTAELVAAEPVVGDPVALAFDERGRMFVAENRGYPTGLGAGKPPAGVIALLEDKDRDGKFEKRIVYADGLTFPNGVLPWRGGVIVTCAPDILFLKDTDEDGRADVRKTLLTGFVTNNTTQLRVSHPTWSIDGWVYVTSGLTGGKVRAPDRPDIPVLDSKGDLRFRPDTLEFESADGKGQFGMTFDDFGHRFHCMNRVHIQHVVLSSKYLQRNPNLLFSETIHNVPESMTPEPLKGHGAAARIWPISQNITTADSHAGTFTAACAVHIHRGTALPQSHYGNAFACDPAGNLVHRDVLRPFGATFSSRTPTEGKEFLASRDDWFRPVFLANGPDGALYICDMYRKTIEHPQYLPEEIRKRTDFESGRGMGRIYRVRKAGPEQRRKSFDLRSASPNELCGLLNHSNAWWRETAHRLIVERNAAEAVRIITNGLTTFSQPASVVHTVRLLEHFRALNDAVLTKALGDAHPFVREQAIELSEARLKESPALRSGVARLAADPDSHVRFRCALAMGNLAPAERVTPLATIARHPGLDRWTRAAILSSASGCEIELLHASLKQKANAPEFLTELGRLAAAASKQLQVADWPTPVLLGITEVYRSRNQSFPQETRDRATQQAAKEFLDVNQPIPARADAALLLGHLHATNMIEQLAPALAVPTSAEALRHAIVRALAIMPSGADKLVEPRCWAGYTPALKEAVLSRAPLPVLLGAVEAGSVPLSAIDSSRRRQWKEHRDERIRDRANRLFQNATSGDRMKVYEEYKSLLKLKADPKNGKRIFAQHCAPCHRLDREGVPVGPDLFGVRNQPKEAILLHVLVPDYEILPGFAGYEVETSDGRVLSGLIAAESPTSLTLRQAQGQEETIARENIATLSATGLSLMPQEMEKNMTRQELADLIAYLKGEL